MPGVLDRPDIHRDPTRSRAAFRPRRFDRTRRNPRGLCCLAMIKFDITKSPVGGSRISKPLRRVVNVVGPRAVIDLIGHRLAEFAVVDHVDASFNLLPHHFSDRTRQPRLEFLGWCLLAIHLDEIQQGATGYPRELVNIRLMLCFIFLRLLGRNNRSGCSLHRVDDSCNPQNGQQSLPFTARCKTHIVNTVNLLGMIRRLVIRAQFVPRRERHLSELA